MDMRNGAEDRPVTGSEPGPGDEAAAADRADRAAAQAGAAGAMTVEVGGASQRLPAEHDYTGDGQPDAAVETADGTVVVFADTEDNETGAPGPDGRADEAYVIDKRTGQVVSAAHLDAGSGSWVSTDGEPVDVSAAGDSPAAEPGRAVEQDPGGAEEARAD